MTTLAEFLLARIDEDEQTVRAVTNNGRLSAVGGVVAESMGDIYAFGRLLAECEAKRRILELHRSGDAWCDHCSGWYGADPAADCPTLRLLALPYSDHPDYRPEWRP